MKQQMIYVLSGDGTNWAVSPWLEHPALAPHAGGRRKVSTASGDVELRIPPLAEGNYKVLGWASQRIEDMHPRPDRLPIEQMTQAELLKVSVQIALEYVALAEDGRGHNARSRYLAQQIREIQQHLIEE
jgi:hypothetical protein